MAGYDPQTGHFDNLADAVAACKALRDGGQAAFDAECDHQLAREAEKREARNVVDMLDWLKHRSGKRRRRKSVGA